MKKQKAKKASGKKEADTKPDSDAAAASEPVEPDVTGAKDDDIAVDEDGHDTIVHRPKTGRQESHEAADSRLRSESFRRGEVNNGPLSPSIEGDAVQDIYRKQVARIEQLERDNKRLQKELDERQKALATSEKEVEELQDAQGDVTSLKAKAAKVDDTTEELKKLVGNSTSKMNQYRLLTIGTEIRNRVIATTEFTAYGIVKATLLHRLASIINIRRGIVRSISNQDLFFGGTRAGNFQSKAFSDDIVITHLRARSGTSHGPINGRFSFSRADNTSLLDCRTVLTHRPERYQGHLPIRAA